MDVATYDIPYYPPTMQYWVLPPEGSTTIHTRTHLALETHMKAGLTATHNIASVLESIQLNQPVRAEKGGSCK